MSILIRIYSKFYIVTRMNIASDKVVAESEKEASQIGESDRKKNRNRK